MDELEFRRRIMSDPKYRDNELNKAIKDNDSNAKFAEEIVILDAQIQKAMNVDVPEGLADRILFNQSSLQDSHITRPNFARRAMAMAASIAFVAGLLIGQINWGHLIVPPAQANLASTAMKHVVDEMPFIRNLDEHVNSSQINVKMAPFLHTLSSRFPYHVYYLNHCGFGQSNALHLVFQGEKGKVTLFLTRIETEATSNFTENGMAGVVEPIGNTSMIIVGNDGEDVAKIAKSIADIIKPLS